METRIENEVASEIPAGIPCPVCGQEVLLITDHAAHPDDATVYATNCECGWSSGWTKDRDHAINCAQESRQSADLVVNLVESWKRDPFWDLAETGGFGAHRAELQVIEAAQKAEWDAAFDARRQTIAEVARRPAWAQITALKQIIVEQAYDENGYLSPEQAYLRSLNDYAAALSALAALAQAETANRLLGELSSMVATNHGDPALRVSAKTYKMG